jgi:hypothetical protein
MQVAECTAAVDGAIMATSAEALLAVAMPITTAAGSVAETAFTEVAAVPTEAAVVSMAAEAPTAADDAKQ